MEIKYILINIYFLFLFREFFLSLTLVLNFFLVFCNFELFRGKRSKAEDPGFQSFWLAANKSEAASYSWSPWYISNLQLHEDLEVPYVAEHISNLTQFRI